MAPDVAVTVICEVPDGVGVGVGVDAALLDEPLHPATPITTAAAISATGRRARKLRLRLNAPNNSNAANGIMAAVAI